MFRDEHMNLYTIFKSAQLLERFCALQRRRFPPHKIKQRFAAKTVDALMPQILYRGGAVAREGDRVARKVKRFAVKIDDHLHLMRRRSFGGAPERMRGGDDVDLTIRTQRLHEAIEQSRFGEWLVALYINDIIELGGFAGDFGDAIGAALVLRRGHRHLCAPIEGSRGDPHVVGSNDDRIQFLRATTAFPDVSKKRFVCNDMQWFSRETRRRPSRWNNSNRLIHLS